jgi:hypothetical protein
MSSIRKSVVRTLSAGAAFGIGVALMAMPANAATNDPPKNDQGQCLVTPSSTKTVNHDEVSHLRTDIIPGSDAVTHAEEVWARNVEGQEAVYNQLTEYFRTIPGTDAVTHEQWMYKHFVPGLTELSHSEYRFSRTNPGQQEQSHKEYTFSRTNPGQQREAHNEYRFTRTNPGQKEISHQEYKYEKTVNEYRFRTRTWIENKKEVKEVQGWNFVDGGTTRVNGQTVAGHWVQSSGWHQIPDVIINIVWGADGPPDNVLGTGRVSLSVYGGPNTTVNYNAHAVDYSGWSDYGPWSDWSTTNPGGDTDKRDTDMRSTVVKYNNGNWTTDVNPSGYTKVDERKVIDQAAVAPSTEYRKADGSATTNAAEAAWFRESSFDGWSSYGNSREVVTQEYVAPFKEWLAQDSTPTTDANNAGWFPKSSMDGWTQESHRKVVDQTAVDPFTEYRKADGTPTTDLSEAAWFRESSFDDWSSYGEPKKVIDQQATEDETFYLTRDSEGNLGQSTDESDATVFTSADGVNTNTWTEYGRKTVTDQEAVPAKDVYLTEDAEGNFGETPNRDEADWIDTDTVVPTIWQQMVDDHGDPLIKTELVSEEIDGYTEYYVPDGAPSREITDDNWFDPTKVDQPSSEDGWHLLEEREVTDQEAVPPVVTIVKVVDKAAWVETRQVPAEYDTCPPTTTGKEAPPAAKTGDVADSMSPLGLGLMGGTLAVLLGGTTALAINARRRGEESMNS